MPTPQEVLEAIHGALREFNMEMPYLNSLDSAQVSSPNLSCVNVAGAILERLNRNPVEWPSSQYIYPSGLFLSVTIMGEPSDCNHGFCVYFHNNIAYVIQAYLGHKVRFITPMDSYTFATNMGRLRSASSTEMEAGYKALSTVDISGKSFKVASIYVFRA